MPGVGPGSPASAPPATQAIEFARGEIVDFVVDADALYFVERTSGEGRTGQVVYAQPKAGGTPKRIGAAENIVGLAVNSRYLFAATASGKKLLRIAKGGAWQSRVTDEIGRLYDQFAWLMVDEEHAFVGMGQRVIRISLDTGEQSVVTEIDSKSLILLGSNVATDSSRAVAGDALWLWDWTRWFRIPKTGTSATSGTVGSTASVVRPDDDRRNGRSSRLLASSHCEGVRGPTARDRLRR